MPIGGYIREREQMVVHMFHSIGNNKLKALLPEVLKVSKKYKINHLLTVVIIVYYIIAVR